MKIKMLRIEFCLKKSYILKMCMKQSQPNRIEIVEFKVDPMLSHTTVNALPSIKLTG